MEQPEYGSSTGAPLNEAAFEEMEWANMTCCDECQSRFRNYFGLGLPPGIRWCGQCQQYECPKHQHEEE